MKIMIFILFLSSISLGAGKMDLKEKFMLDEAKQREILSSIYTLNVQSKKIVIKRSSVESDKQVLESQVNELAHKIKDNTSEQQHIKKTLIRRMRALEELQGEGIYNLLMSASSAHEMDLFSKVISRFMKEDKAKWTDYEKLKVKLKVDESRFLNKLSQLKEKLNEISKEESQIAEIQKKKSKLLLQVKSSMRKTWNKLATANGEDDIFYRSSFFEKKGELKSPISGEVIQKYGLIKNEKDGVVFKNNGIWIEPSAARVQSVSDGKIVYSGYIEGFGKTIVIDHGDHFYTTYSGRINPQVQEGDEVKLSETIAQAEGSLYFEIRHFSESYDPQRWLKGISL